MTPSEEYRLAADHCEMNAAELASTTAAHDPLWATLKERAKWYRIAAVHGRDYTVAHHGAKP